MRSLLICKEKAIPVLCPVLPGASVLRFLYNFKKPERINLKDVRKIQKQTADYIKEGFNKWENEKLKILDWLEVSPSENSNPELMDEKILIKKPEKKLFFKIYTTKKTVTYKLFNLFPVKINRHSH